MPFYFPGPFQSSIESITFLAKLVRVFLDLISRFLAKLPSVMNEAILTSLHLIFTCGNDSSVLLGGFFFFLEKMTQIHKPKGMIGAEQKWSLICLCPGYTPLQVSLTGEKTDLVHHSPE